MNISIIAGDYAHSSDGIGRYTQNLATHLRHQDSNTSVTIVDYGLNSSRKAYNPHSKVPGVIKKIIDPFILELNYFKRFNRNNNVLINRLKNTNSQIYHAVSPSEAVSAVRLNKRPLVTTFHDVIPLLFKNRFLMEKTYFLYYSHIAKKSDIIIADSNSTKQDLINFLNINESKIKVVYPGIDTERFHPIDRKVIKSQNILYLGGLTKRKGIYEVVRAFNILSKVMPNAKLIIGGGGEESYNVKRKVEKLGLTNRISFLGFVKEEELPEIYRQADLFVYPSYYEGFGYTPLEAMASGVPVITSNRSSLPEVVGDAAVTVEPHDIHELEMQMERILNDNEVRNDLRTKGLERAKLFSWERSSSQISNLYKTLLSGN